MFPMKIYSLLVRSGIRRIRLSAIGLGLSAALAHAGDLVGTVSAALGKGALPGATVTVVEKGLTESTDSGGRFRFAGLPAGSYTLNLRFVGYEPRIETVSVPATGVNTVALQLGAEVLRLEKLVVEGFREGRSRALQQKQNQTNIADIVSADALGNLPDRNVAEGISRLPGVNLSLDQGEGRYVSIRGVEPNLNQVLIDGATMAAPGGTRLGRAVPLDTLGAGQISQIEVIKSVTPDLDANAIGGTINIKTASAFDHRERFIAGSVAGSRNEPSGKNSPEFQFTYTDLFGAGKNWGLAASFSYDHRDFENHWVQAAWSPFTYNGAQIYLPNAYEIKPDSGSTKRGGVSLNLEYRASDGTPFFIRPSFSGARTYQNRFESLYSTTTTPAGVSLTSATTGTFTGSGTRTERREFRILVEQSLLSVSTGFKKTLGRFTLEPMLSFSGAREDRGYFNVRQFRNNAGGTGPITFDLGSFVAPRWDVDPAIDTSGKYSLRTTRDDTGLVDEATFTAKTDLRWDADRLLGGHPGFLKTGVKFTQRARTADLDSARRIPVGTWNLGAVGVLPEVPVYDGRYTSGFRLDWDKIDAFIAANPALTTFDAAASAANSIEDDYDIDEYIYAGYAMGSLKLARLTLMAGARWERTDATIRAVEARNVAGTIVGRFPKSGTTAYDKFLPNLQAVYRFTPEVLLRGALTQTIGRPAYEDARPLAQFRYDPLGNATLNPAFPNTGTVSVGNPQLSPYDSGNADLSFEWYLKGGGLLSAAYFHKSIDDPIYSYAETQQNVTYSGVALQRLDLTSKRNADSGKISGVELAAYVPFRFLPSPFDGFGLDANLTRINSSVTIPTRRGEDLPFFRQPSKISSVTLFYERYGFSARVGWTYADEQIYTLGSAPLSDIYRKARGQYDAQLRYRFSAHYAVTASVRNLTREPEQFSFGIRSLVQSSRLLDRDYRLGVNFNY
jgi:TonB-dependent receptor